MTGTTSTLLSRKVSLNPEYNIKKLKENHDNGQGRATENSVDLA